MTARDELTSIIEFRIKPTITYHDAEKEQYTRKARGHREKSTEYLGAAALATGAAGLIGGNPEARAAAERMVSSTAASISHRAPGRLKSAFHNISVRPGKSLNRGLLVAPVALGGAALAHRVGSWINDGKATRAQKNANKARMERYARLQGINVNATRLSSRDELDTILFSKKKKIDYSKRADGKPNGLSPEGNWQDKEITSLSPEEFSPIRRRLNHGKDWGVGSGKGDYNPSLDEEAKTFNWNDRQKAAVAKADSYNFSARSELGLILFGNDPRPRNDLGMFSGGGSEGGPNPLAMKVVYDTSMLGREARPDATGIMGKLTKRDESMSPHQAEPGQQVR